MGLLVFELNDPRWMETVALAQADVFYTESFCRFRYGHGGDRPLMLYYTDDLGSVVDVTVSREVTQLPFFAACAGEFPAPTIDFISPEYNGPIVTSSSADRRQLILNYRRMVDTYLHDSGAVTEFVRIHPLNDCAFELESIEPLTVVSDMFYAKLTDGYEAAVARYRKSHQQVIKRAIKAGMTAEIVEPTQQRIECLAEVYRETMNRKNAASHHKHDVGFFQSLFATLGDRALLIEARARDGTLASIGTALMGNKYLWQFYGVTIQSQLKTGANHLRHNRMIRWGAENGYEALMMGGGVVPGDGIESFKRGFSPISAPVRHMRKVHNRPLLERLVQAKTAYDLRHGRDTRANYFPPYWLT